MASNTMPVTAEQTLKIRRVGGSLTIEGWDQPELEASGETSGFEREAKDIELSGSGNLQVKVLRSLAIQIDFVGGSVEARDLTGPVDISFVGSDLRLRDLSGQVTFRGLVGGTTRLENVSQIATAAGGVGPFGGAAGGAWRKVEKVMEEANAHRSRMEKKFQKAQRKMNRFGFGWDSDGGRWKWRHWSRSILNPEPAESVSEEERMTILRMVQDKKITAEEADRLLAALEGQA